MKELNNSPTFTESITSSKLKVYVLCLFLNIIHSFKQHYTIIDLYILKIVIDRNPPKLVLQSFRAWINYLLVDTLE